MPREEKVRVIKECMAQLRALGYEKVVKDMQAKSNKPSNK